MILADFPHKHLTTRPEHIGERLLDVREGVVLVETGYDAQPLLDAISKGADLIRGARFISRGMYISFRDGNAHANEAPGINSKHSDTNFYSIVTLQFERVIGSRALDKISEVGGSLLRGILTEINPEVAVDDIGDSVNVNIANRCRGGKVGHLDYVSVITAWFGATQPGLRIREGNDWMHIPDAPSGHALIWRGVDFMGEDEAIRHTVDYRGKDARVSAIAF